MKSTLFALALSLVAASTTASAGGMIRSGCYALGVPGTSGLVCIDGIEEESMSGEGTEAVLVDGQGEVLWCNASTSLQMKSADITVLNFSGGISLTFDSSTVPGRFTLTQASGTDTQDYSKFNVSSARFFNSAKCKARGFRR